MKTLDTQLLLEGLGKMLLREIVSEANCPKCTGTLLGLRATSVLECHDCHKVFQRITDQDETYYIELIRVH
jgi:ribosomal protein L37AE/L43A